MRISRRALMGAMGSTFALPFLGTAAFAADDTITIVLPYGAGGPTDGMARYLADELTRKLGRTFLVENKPGANGIIAAQYVTTTKQPQNTLLVGGTGPISLNVMLRKSLPFTLEDLRPVSLVANGPMAMTVPTSSSINTLDEFVERAKTQDKPMRFGTLGPGSLSQLYGALLSDQFGIELIEVAYKSSAEEIKDILGGQVDFTVSSPFGVIGQINAGAMKMLAVASSERMAQLPDVPTFAELGHPELTASFWTAIFAPAAMDDALVSEINAAISDVLNTPETDEMMNKIGQFTVGGTPDVLAAQLEEDKAKWGSVIKARNMVLE